MGIEELAVECLVVPPEPANPPGQQPPEAGRAAVRSEQTAKRPAVGARHPIPAPHSKGLREEELLVPVVVIDGAGAMARISQALDQMLAHGPGPLIGRGMPDDGALVLDVVVQGVVDVVDLSACEGDDREPMVVEWPRQARWE